MHLRFTTILLLFFCLTVQLSAQNSDFITLTTYGYGSDQDEATQNALRNAVEEAFGTFVSSKSEILNDKLVTDEITSVSSGNIQDYSVLSKLKQEDSSYSVTVRATVSISNLIQFTENKGGEADLKGGMFARNIKLQQLNEESEYRTIKNITEVLKDIADRSFDFTIRVEEPTQVEGEPNQFKIPVEVRAKLNSNFQNFKSYLFESLQGIAMTQAEVENYIRLNKDVYKVVIFKDKRADAPILDSDQYAHFQEGDGRRFDFFLGGRNIFALDWDWEQDVLMYGYFGDKQPPQLLEELYPLIKKEIKDFLDEHFVYDEFYLRNSKSDILVKNLIHYLAHSLQNFEISTGIDSFRLYDLQIGEEYLEEHKETVTALDYWFRPGLNRNSQRYYYPSPLMKATNIKVITTNYFLVRTERVRYKNRENIIGNEYFVSLYEFTEKAFAEAKSDNTSKTYLEEILNGEREAYHFGGSLNLRTDDDDREPYSFFYQYDELERRAYFDEQMAVERNFPFLSLLDTFGTELDFCKFLYRIGRRTGRFMSNRFIDYEQCEIKSAHNHSKHKSISIFSFISLSAEDGTSAIFNFDDIRSLEELNNISGYSVAPLISN
jgi:hypothetical protein